MCAIGYTSPSHHRTDGCALSVCFVLADLSPLSDYLYSIVKELHSERSQCLSIAGILRFPADWWRPFFVVYMIRHCKPEIKLRIIRVQLVSLMCLNVSLMARG